MDRVTAAALRLTHLQRKVWALLALEQAERASERAEAHLWISIAESVGEALRIESEALDAHSGDAADAEVEALLREAVEGTVARQAAEDEMRGLLADGDDQ